MKNENVSGRRVKNKKGGPKHRVGQLTDSVGEIFSVDVDDVVNRLKICNHIFGKHTIRTLSDEGARVGGGGGSGGRGK